MQPGQFVAGRRERWERLEALLRSIGKDARRASGDELLELGRLYRTISSDYAIARRDFRRDRVVDYLNNLLARAHPVVYRRPPADLGATGRFFRYGFPAAYRSAGAYTAVAFALFAVAALISALLVAVRPSLADVLLPGTAQSLRAVMVHHHLWVKSATSNHSVAANFIMINNIRVAFFAFAGGLLLGLGTVYIMIQNGIMLGVTAAMVAQYRLSTPFWAFIVPHGVIELSVIFMAGGAGLMMGDAILRPGLLRRRDAVAHAGRRAIDLVFGAVPLLMIAGTIEAFFSPSDAPALLKFAFAAVAGALLYGYLLLSRPAARSRMPLDEPAVPIESTVPV